MADRLAYPLYRNFWAAVDWLFPPRCGGCRQPGSRWCRSCQQKVSILGEILCPICGQPQRKKQICPKCHAAPPSYHALRSWAEFAGPIRNALHQLKYRGNMSQGEVLSRPLIAMMQRLGWPTDMVIPVPLSLARLSERGYNQAALLARPIAMAMRIEYRPAFLKKTRHTISQVGLSAAERRGNVSGAFSADHSCAGRCILLVDDVTTSGATLDECSAALKAAGAVKVYGLTLARAVLSEQSHPVVPMEP